MRSKSEIREIVVACLQETVEQAGFEKPENIRDDTDPIRHLGLNSPMGINFACAVSAKGIIVPNNDNPFVDDEQKRSRTVGEIVEHLVVLAAKIEKEPAHNG